MAIAMIKLTKTTRDNDFHADGSEEDEDVFYVVNVSTSWEDRAKFILNYGFACHRARCKHQSKRR